MTALSRATFVDRPAHATADSPTPEQALSLGELLEARRVRFGLTPLELSSRTRIRVEYVQALEQGDLERLPERLLVKGYLKVLSLELDLNEIRLFKALDAVWPLESVLWKPAPRFEFPWWLMGGVVAALCSLLIVGWGVLAAVRAGSSLRVAAKFDPVVETALPQQVPFSLTTYPKGAEVYVDGNLLGLTPIKGFPLTQRSSGVLKVVFEGFKTHTATLELNRPRSLEFSLEALPKKTVAFESGQKKP